ncbi:MAG: hypothetical protein ACLVIY_09335 [Anaerobutyricum soehngenii]
MKQWNFLVNIVSVEADKEKTESVIRTIQQKISFRAYQMVYHAAMAADEEEKLEVYLSFNIGISLGRQILDSLQNPINENILLCLVV